jgi:anti-sigma regulatory factor (Ser/Thr protein kinase)
MEPNEMSRSFTLVDETGLARVRSLIRADLARVGVSSSDVFDCLVAVTEACSNAIRHGGVNRVPTLSWHLEDDLVRFCVRDFSTEQWSRRAHPSRSYAAGDGPDERIGGFGLDLMRGLMDEVDIRIGSGGTVVELSKALN